MALQIGKQYRVKRDEWQHTGIPEYVLARSDGYFTLVAAGDTLRNARFHGIYAGDESSTYSVLAEWVESVSEPTKVDEAIALLREGLYTLEQAEVVKEAIELLESLEPVEG